MSRLGQEPETSSATVQFTPCGASVPMFFALATYWLPVSWLP